MQAVAYKIHAAFEDSGIRNFRRHAGDSFAEVNERMQAGLSEVHPQGWTPGEKIVVHHDYAEPVLLQSWSADFWDYEVWAVGVQPYFSALRLNLAGGEDTGRSIRYQEKCETRRRPKPLAECLASVEATRSKLEAARAFCLPLGS